MADQPVRLVGVWEKLYRDHQIRVAVDAAKSMQYPDNRSESSTGMIPVDVFLVFASAFPNV